MFSNVPRSLSANTNHVNQPRETPPTRPLPRSGTMPSLSLLANNIPLPQVSPILKNNSFRTPQASNINLKENLQICSICCDDVTKKQGYQLPGCDHIYHPICIGQWLATPMKKMSENENPLTKTEIDCPNCRKTINLTADNNLIAFNKILQRYKILANAAPMYAPFIEKLISRALGTETPNQFTNKQLQLKLIPKKAWDSLPGLRSYLTFLETSKICLSQISYAAQELIENNFHPDDINEDNLASLLHLLDSMKTMHSLLDNAQPYSIKNVDGKDRVVDDEQHMPVSLLDLSNLKKAFASTIQELDLSILFLLICKNNKKQEAL